MSDGTKIEWTDATWNPVTGCSVVSPGCTNCYAMRLAGGRLQHHPSRAGLTQPSKAGPVWNGQVRFNDEWLDQPLKWSRPRRIFVCAHGDLFHESVPDEWIDKVFGVMALAPQHQFQVLTKRAARMRRYLADRIQCTSWTIGRADQIEIEFQHIGADHRLPTTGCFPSWPLPNVWLGVSVEDQTRAAERVPELLATPAAVRFLSVEPMLGPVDLTTAEGWLWHYSGFGLRQPVRGWPDHPGPNGGGIDWVICGGESGFDARPMNPAWARALRDQCVDAGVAFHFKQWGAWGPIAGDLNGVGHNNHAFPDGAVVWNLGKARAGRTLDGRTWDEFPRLAL